MKVFVIALAAPRGVNAHRPGAESALAGCVVANAEPDGFTPLPRHRILRAGTPLITTISS